MHGHPVHGSQAKRCLGNQFRRIDQAAENSDRAGGWRGGLQIEEHQPHYQARTLETGLLFHLRQERIGVGQFKTQARRTARLSIGSQLRFEEVVTQHAAVVLLPVPGKCLAAPSLHGAIRESAIEKEQRGAGIGLFLGGKRALSWHDYSWTRESRRSRQEERPGPVLTTVNSGAANRVSG